MYKMDKHNVNINLQKIDGLDLHNFLHKLLKINETRRQQLREDDAVELYNLLKQEGYFKKDFNNCAVCALDDLDKKLITQGKLQLEILRQAKHYYQQCDNAKIYQLCCSHTLQPKDEEPRNDPRLYLQTKSWSMPIMHSVAPPQLRTHIDPRYHQIHPMPYYIQDHTYLAPNNSYDSFVQIPDGVNPNVFMQSYNDWVKHFQEYRGTDNHRRMPYTRSFPLEKTDESKVVGRRNF